MLRPLVVLPVLVLGFAGCSSHRAVAPATTTQLTAASSSAVASSATASPKSSAPSTSASAGTGLSAFVGHWAGHGRSLVVNADSSGKIVARTYQKCGDPGVSGACDTFDGDEIKPGAITQITITGTHEDVDVVIADFTVRETTLGVPPNSAGTLTLNQAHDALQVTINGQLGAGYYCGPKADPGYCGA